MKARIIISLGIGVFVDVMLRLFSGDEGNLLVHTAVFLGSAGLALLLMKGFSLLQTRIKKQEQDNDRMKGIS